MRRFITIILATVLAFTLASCAKEGNDKKDFSVEFISSIDNDKTEFDIDELYLELESDMAESSCLYALGSNGAAGFEMKIYMKSITKINVGTLIAPSLVNFIASTPADGSSSAYFYKGKVTMTNKTADKVTFVFEDVKFELSSGDVKINGKLVCPIE
ncbi:MAG: hypothetical protein MJZ16_06960 [Bacteroidales bacterium]|nr:hypothetical protein [Bacteroidales bacterium]